MEKRKETDRDYLQYDRIWQRVAPELNPYPKAREALAAHKQQPMPPHKEPDSEETVSLTQLEGLMGTMLTARCTYLRYARCAPHTQGRCTLQQMAGETEEDVRRLMSYYYVTTGKGYPTSARRREDTPLQPWCQMLRKCYQEECRSAEHCRKMAECTEDRCLQEILTDVAERCHNRAARLLRLLGCNMLA